MSNGCGWVILTVSIMFRVVVGVECIIIFDVIEPLLKDVAAKFNVPSTTTNADDVINHPDVNAVWICSPSQFHADQIKVWKLIQISEGW